jgi:uncharacterized repeat protein (TIGR01451 family)
MIRTRNRAAAFLVILASLLMVGVFGVSHAEDCPDQGGIGADNGIINPPDTDDKKHGCDDEDTKSRENNGPGNDADCEDDSNGRVRRGCEAAVGLTLHKTASFSQDAGRVGAPDPGDVIRYTIAFGNSGPGTATNVVVRDVVNEGLVANGCPAGGDQPTNYVTGSASSTLGTVSFGAGVVTVSIASLASGQSGTLTFEVSVPTGTFHDCNRATISSAQTTTPLASNTVSL